MIMSAGSRGESAEASSAACIDAHLHVDLYGEKEQGDLLEAAFRNGVEAVVAVSMHLASSAANRAWAQRYPGRVYPAYGFHPEQPLPSEADCERLFAWIRERHDSGERFAIGEVGLPYYMRTEAEAAGEHFDEAPYLVLLEQFIRLAAELERPIVLHAVYEDADKACALLEKYRVRKAHFHWFKGHPTTIRRMTDAGYYVSITPDVAYEAEIRQLVERYPLERLMAETDGPWPFEGPYAGRRTEPAMVKDVAMHIARIKGISEIETTAALLHNTKRFYNI